MYQRQILEDLGQYLQEFPAVAILGPRQVGKTTLAHQLSESHTQPQPALYQDLESPPAVSFCYWARPVLSCWRSPPRGWPGDWHPWNWCHSC